SDPGGVCTAAPRHLREASDHLARRLRSVGVWCRDPPQTPRRRAVPESSARGLSRSVSFAGLERVGVIERAFAFPETGRRADLLLKVVARADDRVFEAQPFGDA